MTVDIEAMLAVPEDVAQAIDSWRDLDRFNDPPGCSPAEAQRVRDAWVEVGRAIEAHVAEKVADALRIERGGCTHCPAAKGEAHKLDCRRPDAGITRLNLEFKP